MYKAYNLKLGASSSLLTNCPTSLNRESEYARSKIRSSLEKFILGDGTLSGDEISDAWFPLVETEIFISHSHKDEKLAISLANWISENTGLACFIDSTVWGHSETLQNQIDKTYCNKTENGYYDRKHRNYLVSHVCAMLSMALAKMMDRSEIVIFLNTPSSISFHSALGLSTPSTYSPWLMTELSLTKLIATKAPREHRRRIAMDSLAEASLQQNIVYSAPIDHLIPLDTVALNAWRSLVLNPANKYRNMDLLYTIAA